MAKNDFQYATVDMSLCISLQKFYSHRTTEKNDVMSIFKMADLSHLGL